MLENEKESGGLWGPVGVGGGAARGEGVDKTRLMAREEREGVTGTAIRAGRR